MSTPRISRRGGAWSSCASASTRSALPRILRRLLRPSPKKKTTRASLEPRLLPFLLFLPCLRANLRLACALLLGLCAASFAAPARAALTSVVVEIDAAAERVVDARSLRRLVPLELSDVTVPSGAARGAPALFFRVLGRSDGSLRIELWERGEYHGQRALISAGENPQLVARRVALAAAELGRRLARKRQALLARDERLRLSRAASERAQRERTQDGPLALRSELGYAAVPGELSLFGSRLNGEVSLYGPLRLDLGAELWAGRLQPELGVLLQGLSIGPAYRAALTPALDLDLAARGAVLLLQVPGARSLDAILEQNSSWTARLDGALRLELRLTRQLRGFVGGEAGALLRSVPFTTAGAESRRLSGLWWGASLGLVVTPAR
jgi:hypothetical protein